MMKMHRYLLLCKYVVIDTVHLRVLMPMLRYEDIHVGYCNLPLHYQMNDGHSIKFLYNSFVRIDKKLYACGTQTPARAGSQKVALRLSVSEPRPYRRAYFTANPY